MIDKKKATVTTQIASSTVSRSPRFRTRLRCLLKSLSRKVFLPKVPQNVSVLVVSPGGVATTMLIKHISKFRVTNHLDDHDGLKHLPRVPREVSRRGDLKVIFVKGNLEEITNSISRRNWLHLQSAKLGAPLGTLGAGVKGTASFKKAVQRQQSEWTAFPNEKIVAIDYSEIWSNIEKISKFIGVDDENFVKDFPEKKLRNAN